MLCRPSLGRDMSDIEQDRGVLLSRTEVSYSESEQDRGVLLSRTELVTEQDRGVLPREEEQEKEPEKGVLSGGIKIPSDLEPYRPALERWMEHHRSSGLPRYTRVALEAFWDECRELGDGLTAAIRHSVSKRYKGVYAAPQANSSGRGPGRRSQADVAWEEFQAKYGDKGNGDD